MATLRLAAAVAALLAVLMRPASGRFVVEKESIMVIAPESIKGRFDASIANFGVPNYGGTLTGVVIYPERGRTGCNAFDRDPFRSKSKRPVILLVDRGACYFALKAYNGQQAGAAAVLVADSVDEPLLTMAAPEEDNDNAFVEKINIPSALITLSFGNKLKDAFAKGGSEEVVVKMDWRESMPHPDERVEYEFWTNSNDECGDRCDEQVKFVRDFKGNAQILEKGGFTLFTPHYITWYCPDAFKASKECKSQCINNGRYCAPDPENDFDEGYDGKDIVVENLRQLCVHRVANESGRPWAWWDFVTDYHVRCSMKEKKFSKECAEDVVTSLGLSLEKISKCMGNSEDDAENEVLSIEQELQVGHGSRGDVTILPTLMINNVQYRGKLERTSVLKAICAGFKESTEPHVCLNPDMETNECLTSNGGCWKDTGLNITACKVIKPKLVRPLRIPVTSCAWDHDGKHIVGGIGDGSIQRWSIKPGWGSRPDIYVENAHADDITGLKFSTDGQVLLSRSTDNTLKVWDLRKTKMPLAVFVDLPNNYAQTNAAFSPDEHLILTGTCVEKEGTAV